MLLLQLRRSFYPCTSLAGLPVGAQLGLALPDSDLPQLPAGLFKGNSLTVLKTLPQSAIQFWTYDTAKDLLLAARVQRKHSAPSCEQQLSQVLTVA